MNIIPELVEALERLCFIRDKEKRGCVTPDHEWTIAWAKAHSALTKYREAAVGDEAAKPMRVSGASMLRDMVAADIVRNGAMSSTMVRAGLLLDILNDYLAPPLPTALDEQGAIELLQREWSPKFSTVTAQVPIKYALRAIQKASRGER